MSKKKQVEKIDTVYQNTILRKEVHQLHINLKRGLLPYVILFFLKIRPHYSLEIQRKMSHLEGRYFKIRQNIIYQNLNKFEKKGIVESYLKKSAIGAKRKYYYLTKLGEQLFEEVVIKRLDPLMFMFTTIMEHRITEFGLKRSMSKKELERIHNTINAEIDK